ncbi:MAG: two-component system, response regulator YesN [Clostridiales bacterium]|nr:two-component system, response regulator YesN [Clostridiales bacterium]
MKIIVAEDEFYAKKMLLKLLQEMPMPMEVCLEAETGKQAAAYLSGQAVDLVITDIRMPEMDGLLLAKYVKEHCPKTDVVIVSGYSDFQYAREAMLYGVRNYLTKPVKKEELEKTLLTIVREREAEEQRRLKDSLQYLSLASILTVPVLVDQLFTLCGLTSGRESYRLYLFQGNGHVSTEEAEKFRLFLSGEGKEIDVPVFYFLQTEELAAIVPSKGEEWEKRNIDHLHRRLHQYEHSITCGVSRVFHGREFLKDAYRDCVYAMNGRLLEDKTRLFLYEPEPVIEQLFTKQEELTLYESVWKGNFEQAKEILHLFLQKCKGNKKNVYSLYSSIMQIYSVINRAYCNKEALQETEEVNRYLLFSYQSDLYQYRSLQELEGYLIKILENTCWGEEKKDSIIEEVKQYVAQNFRYDISLQELAEHKFFLNASYLSRLFKAETGMNFSKYLIHYRMEQAKELLTNTVFKVNEIADYVGYNDTSYFIQTYKRFFGMTPEQYRLLQEKK